MSHTNCERCQSLPPPITSGPWKGSRHELRYCAYCSKDLCDDCLKVGRCRETPKEDQRHRVEADCAVCDGASCDKCEDGTVLVLIEEVPREQADA
jgi:hypothetical protein